VKRPRNQKDLEPLNFRAFCVFRGLSELPDLGVSCSKESEKGKAPRDYFVEANLIVVTFSGKGIFSLKIKRFN